MCDEGEVMKYKKVITGADGEKYEISSDIDCLENIYMSAGYIGGFSVETLYEIGSVTIKEIEDKPLIKKTETSYEHILRKMRRKINV